ncbi:hypothetical protein D3C81_1633710 [compost metagenome]
MRVGHVVILEQTCLGQDSHGPERVMRFRVTGCEFVSPWLGIALGPSGAWLGFFGGAQTERRPRGASRAKLAPTFVSGQLFL